MQLPLTIAGIWLLRIPGIFDAPRDTARWLMVLGENTQQLVAGFLCLEPHGCLYSHPHHPYPSLSHTWSGPHSLRLALHLCAEDPPT